ncbi:MAG: class I SAM-dependent methyltransferase [Saprospiraceae bacterium]
MEKFTTSTEEHYHRSNLFEEIINRLEKLDIDMTNVKREDIAGVDEFHVRGAQVSKELAKSIDIKNTTVLDVGCGLGGPARMLADEYGCQVTGIDLSQEFIRTATNLSELVGLSSKTKFVYGNATELPFEDKSFDVVWTQHVQMNVEDKEKFYSEINRVLSDKGIFLYYDIFKNGKEEVTYPMPWASEPKISFLVPPIEMESILSDLNFKTIQSIDQTNKGIFFFEKFMERINQFGAPKLGLNVLMGASTKTKISNLLNGLKEGNLILQSGVFIK